MLHTSERSVLEMLRGCVARRTGVPQLPLMLIRVAVHARGAVRTVEFARMTIDALRLGVEVLMKPIQNEARILVVIKAPCPRSSLDMAALARLIRELPLVCFAMLVAARASPFFVRHPLRSDVAAFASKRLMPSHERKAIFRVICGGLFPRSGRRVALGAIRRLPSRRMDRYFCMAICASPRRRSPCHDGLRMTLRARKTRMSSIQGSLRNRIMTGFPILKPHAPKGRTWRVTLVAVLRKVLVGEAMGIAMTRLAIARQTHVCRTT